MGAGKRDVCPTRFKLPLPLPALLSPETLLAPLSDLRSSFSPKVIKHVGDPALDPGTLLACPSALLATPASAKPTTTITLGPCRDSKWVPMPPLQHRSASPAPCHSPAYLDPGTAPGTALERSRPGRWASWRRRWPWLHPAGRRETRSTSRCAGGLAPLERGEQAGGCCLSPCLGGAGRAVWCQRASGQAAPPSASKISSLATDA